MNVGGLPRPGPGPLRGARPGALAAVLLGLAACAPGSDSGAPSAAADPNAIEGELVTYVADFLDGHSERYQALRPTTGP